MILVDSSLWVLYFRKDGNERVRESIKTALVRDEVAINGIIVVEILGGISKTKEYRFIEENLKGLHFIELTRDDFYNASKMSSELRAKGITVPATDLIIAASAINHRLVLYHLDKHFDLIAMYYPLDAMNFKKLI